MFVAGVVRHLVFHRFAGLGSGLLGSALRFGVLFVLWMVGFAGGGDVKLLGVLSVWLGPMLTLCVILGSLLFVILGTFVVLFTSVMERGWRGTRNKFIHKSSGNRAAGRGRRSVKNGESWRL